MKVAYLGPPGTFTHNAATAFFSGQDVDAQPRGTVIDVLRSVGRGRCAYGVVPIENSVQGEVTTTMDHLVFDFHDLVIAGEVLLTVSFCALRKAGDDSVPSSIHSHPYALAQCTRYIGGMGVPTIVAKSTAEACEMVATHEAAGAIAIASSSAGQRYGLDVVAASIEDFPGAVTKFFVVGTQFARPTGDDKTTFVLLPKHQQMGVLAEILGILSQNGVDVKSVHSRPIRRRMGTYYFFFTISGHLCDDRVFATLASFVRLGHNLKFLGSYASFPGLTAREKSEPNQGFQATVAELEVLRNNVAVA